MLSAPMIFVAVTICSAVFGTQPQMRPEAASSTSSKDVGQVYALVLDDLLKHPQEEREGNYFVVETSTQPVNSFSSEVIGLLAGSKLIPEIPSNLRSRLLQVNRHSTKLPVTALPSAKLIGPKSINRVFAGKGSWRDFYRVHPNSLGYVSFSIPVFTDDGQKALLFISQACGNLCGASWLVYLSMENGAWKIQNKACFLVS